VELYQVRLFYHPSCDHLDPSPDCIEKFFTLSTSVVAAVEKVFTILEKEKPSFPSHYRTDSEQKVLPQGVTPKQALLVLQVVGLRVI